MDVDKVRRCLGYQYGCIFTRTIRLTPMVLRGYIFIVKSAAGVALLNLLQWWYLYNLDSAGLQRVQDLLIRFGIRDNAGYLVGGT